MHRCVAVGSSRAAPAPSGVGPPPCVLQVPQGRSLFDLYRGLNNQNRVPLKGSIRVCQTSLQVVARKHKEMEIGSRSQRLGLGDRH